MGRETSQLVVQRRVSRRHSRFAIKEKQEANPHCQTPIWSHRYISQPIPEFHWLLPNILVESTSESIKTYADIKSALLLEILRDVLGDVKSISLRGKHPSVCVCSCRGNYSDLMGYRFVWKYSLPSFLNLPNIFPVWKIRNPTKRGNSLRSWNSSRIGFLQQGKSSDPCWIVARLPTICSGLSSSRTNRSSPTI